MDMTVEVPELPELTFDEASHIYRLNGDIIPSVSKLMEPLKDQCYGGISKRTLENAAIKGSAVHNSIENWIKFGIDDIPSEHRGYFNGFMEWWKQYKPRVFGSEVRIYHKLLSPAVHFDFKNITFSFLPHQVKDMDALVKNLESSAPEIIGVAPYEQCKQFIEALARYQKFSDIRNVGAAIHSMIESVTEKMDEVGFKDDEEWTYLTKIFGSNAIPAESAATITKAIKKAEKDGAITSKNRWQLIEMLATEYLAGK